MPGDGAASPRRRAVNTESTNTATMNAGETPAEEAARLMESKLSDNWSVETDGDGDVYGYADGLASGAGDPGAVPASFDLHRGEGALWTATWSTPNPMRGGFHGSQQSVEGVLERCAEWLTERADALEGVRL